MTVRLIKSDSENECVEKSVLEYTDVECVLVNTDINHPVFKLSSEYVDYNYAYVEDFGRYYFVNKPEGKAGTHILLRCNVDVLMSYKDELLELECSVVRNEVIPIGDIVDEKLPIKAKRRIVSFEFGDRFDGDRRFILSCV